MYSHILESPIGKIYITASDVGIRTISRKETVKNEGELAIPNEHIEKLSAELDLYFRGELQEFTVAVDISGYTTFQQEVWNELRNVLYGTTASYKQLAISLGDVKKIRAVGRANGANPIPIVIPCHRIIGSDGALVGYSGGLDMKEFLLQLEGLPMQGKLF